MGAEERALTALAAAQVHNEAESRVRSARASADAGDRDAFRTLVVGSGVSVIAAVAKSWPSIVGLETTFRPDNKLRSSRSFTRGGAFGARVRLARRRARSQLDIMIAPPM